MDHQQVDGVKSGIGVESLDHRSVRVRAISVTSRISAN
jgi:hypothetical protein